MGIPPHPRPETRSDRTPDTAMVYPRVYDSTELRAGDEIAYVGARKHRVQRLNDPRDGYAEPTDRDWICVTRVDGVGAHGFRVHPEEWERDVEYVVVALQIRDHGVEVRLFDSTREADAARSLRRDIATVSLALGHVKHEDGCPTATRSHDFDNCNCIYRRADLALERIKEALDAAS